MPSHPTLTLPPRERVRQAINKLIQDGAINPGQRLPSERELAKSCGVARMTARAVLQELAIEGQVDHRSGYGRRVKNQQRDWLMSRTITMLSHATSVPLLSLATGQERFVQASATYEIERRGLNCLLVNPVQTDEEWLKRFLAERPLGIIATFEIAQSEIGRTLLGFETSHGVPVAVYGDDPSLAKYNRVFSDHFAGARDLVHWLAARNRRRILRFWTMAHTEQPYWLAQRNAGCEAALQEAGLPVLPAVQVPMVWQGPEHSRSGFECDCRLILGWLVDFIKDPATRPDAIMAVNDVDAAKIATAISMYGLDPGKDIVVTGYDNFWPQCPERTMSLGAPCATIDKRNQAIGEELVRIALEPPGQSPARVLVPHEVISCD